MGRQVVDLITLTSTAAGTNSTIATELDDAVCIGIALVSTTTAGNDVSNIQVELTATGTDFMQLSYDAGTQASYAVSSSRGVMIDRIGFRQLRLASTAASAGARTYQITKQIEV